MAEDAPDSPPLPKRGAYNIDFDALDDSINPFESKVQLGSSPPISSRMCAPSFGDDDKDLIDPFKPSNKLASSPPGLPKVKSQKKSVDADEKSTAPPPEVADPVEGDPAISGPLDDGHSGDVKQSTPVTPKKKKVVKKPKAQSKLKLPKNVKPPQNNIEDIQIFMPGTEGSNSQGQLESTGENLPSSPGLQEVSPAEENIPSPEPKAKEKVKSSKGIKDIKDEAPVNETENDEPFDAAADAMASSSEIDHQFIDPEDIDEPEHVNEGFAPSGGAFDGQSDWDVLQKYSEGGEGKATELPDDSLLTNFDPLTSPGTKKLAKPSATPEKAEDQIQSDEDLLVVNTPPAGSQAEAASTKHPAVRALETAQADNNTKGADGKNESSSEESQFYDAYEFPPVATTKSKLGQKNSTGMERGPNHEEGGDNKGTVVQLVQDVGHSQVLRYSQSDWNKMKQEMELNFQATLLNKERDWSLMLAERDKKIGALEETNRKVKHTNEDMRMVVAEFEKTISQLQADKEKSKTDSHKTTQALESERDQAIEDLQSVEAAFSDLHRRYEKSKSIIEGFKRNEEQLKMCVEDLQNKLKKSDSKLQSLRSQAEEKLDRANEDIEKIKKSTKADVVRLEAALKKAELRISSLEESLQRKEKENHELTAICDELIAKVGS